MKRIQAQESLKQALAEIALAQSHLDYSFQKIIDLPENLDNASPAQLESVEAFCSRFSRLVDLLVNKALRSLDRFELHSGGTLLDVVHRAEKRGIVEDDEDLREMKEVRNMIAHDYAGANVAEILAYCRNQKPVLDAVCGRLVSYAAGIL